MKKCILNTTQFKVAPSDNNKFVKLMTDLKTLLENNDALPLTFDLFHNIDNDEELWYFYTTFESKEAFQKWGEKTYHLWTDELRNNYGKYLVSFSFSEQIISK